jgi:hypothetical protein
MSEENGHSIRCRCSALFDNTGVKQSGMLRCHRNTEMVCDDGPAIEACTGRYLLKKQFDRLNPHVIADTVASERK